MDAESLSYEIWVEEALRAVIKRALKQTEAVGLPGDHHFFITFTTNRDDVIIPAHLQAEHPEEMTIVLQHQFHDLAVTNDGFSVTLSFSGRPCHLSIPYSAITSFADPAVNFVLQLKMQQIDEDGEDEPSQQATRPLAAVETEPALAAEVESAEENDEALPSPESDEDKMGEVITLDAFRKK